MCTLSFLYPGSLISMHFSCGAPMMVSPWWRTTLAVGCSTSWPWSLTRRGARWGWEAWRQTCRGTYSSTPRGTLEGHKSQWIQQLATVHYYPFHTIMLTQTKLGWLWYFIFRLSFLAQLVCVARLGSTPLCEKPLGSVFCCLLLKLRINYYTQLQWGPWPIVLCSVVRCHNI